MDISKGYLRLYRQILEWEWYDNPFVKAIFFHCLINANDRPKDWRDIKLKRGQFVTSYEKLAAANGMTIQQTRTALKQLQLTQEIEYQSTNQYTVITVKNYNLYQANNTQKSEANSTPTNKRKGGQLTTTNNIDIKSIDIYKSSSSSNKNFEEFYKNLSEEEEEILKNYSMGEKIRYFRPWLRKIFENGDFKEVLSKAVAKDKKEKQKMQRYSVKEEVPPEKPETKEETEEARKKYLETTKNLRRRKTNG